MNIKKRLQLSYWIPDRKKYLLAFERDKELYESWTGVDKISLKQLKTVEFRYLKNLRKAQANDRISLWGKHYRKKLARLTEKTGIWIPADIKCGTGLIIAHWGRIIVNPDTVIGDNFSISSGSVIGRDIRGKRKGVPRFGNNVVIKTNAMVIGNITIGDDVLIAPGAYVNFDVPSHSIVVGNPGVIHHRVNATEGYI